METETANDYTKKKHEILSKIFISREEVEFRIICEMTDKYFKLQKQEEKLFRIFTDSFIEFDPECKNKTLQELFKVICDRFDRFQN